MYVIKAVRVSRGNLRGVMNRLRAWYAIKKLFAVSRRGTRIVYYLAADKESQEVLVKVLEANGYRVEVVEELKEIPWYLREIVENLKAKAEEVSLKRKCLELLKPVFRGEASVKEIADKYGINYDKLLKIKRRLSKSVLIEFIPRVGTEELFREAVRTGLIPLSSTLYYSGSFNSKVTVYQDVIEKLHGVPYSEFHSRLKEVATSLYGINARRVINALRNNMEYHRVLALSRVREMRKSIDFDYNIYTLSD